MTLGIWVQSHIIRMLSKKFRVILLFSNLKSILQVSTKFRYEVRSTMVGNLASEVLKTLWWQEIPTLQLEKRGKWVAASTHLLGLTQGSNHLWLRPYTSTSFSATKEAQLESEILPVRGSLHEFVFSVCRSGYCWMFHLRKKAAQMCRPFSTLLELIRSLQL